MDTVPARGRDAAGRPIAPVVASAPAGRRRRPSGAPPPLPRHIDRTTRWYLAFTAATVILWIGLAVTPVLAVVTAGDDAVLRAVAGLRTEPVTQAMRGVSAVASEWVVRPLAWGTIAVLLAVRRVQHLAAYLLLLLGVSLVATAVSLLLGRMRPTGVTILGDWHGYAHPSLPVTALALVLVGVLHTLVPEGPSRLRATWVAAAVVGAVCAARLYLGVDHPTDVLAALALGWAVPTVVYRLATPAEGFPVTYRGGGRAHLDVGGPRGRAIRQALEHQLGLRVTDVEAFGLEGSAGSTPLRMQCRGRDDTGGTETTLFGKLYALNHLRSDRWYKLSRMVLYGRLEDEKPFSTVRRLAEYEDHMLRLMRDVGLPAPTPYGFVEITPEREYLVVMEFLEDCRELGKAAPGDAEIDSGLRIVRRMWEVGVAHRDIKPSNLLVRRGQVVLIDVAFAAVRPTPWRQAVDLANMMISLALSSTPERVYARALQQFAPEDIAEAFAASRSVTIPTQVRSRLKADGRDIVGEFRRLAPQRPPVAIQLWGVRRVALAMAVVLGAVVAAAALVAYVTTASLL